MVLSTCKRPKTKVEAHVHALKRLTVGPRQVELLKDMLEPTCAWSEAKGAKSRWLKLCEDVEEPSSPSSMMRVETPTVAAPDKGTSDSGQLKLCSNRLKPKWASSSAGVARPKRARLLGDEEESASARSAVGAGESRHAEDLNGRERPMCAAADANAELSRLPSPQMEAGNPMRARLRGEELGSRCAEASTEVDGPK